MNHTTCQTLKGAIGKIEITSAVDADVNLQLLVNIVSSLVTEVEHLSRRIEYLEGVCFDNDGR